MRGLVCWDLDETLGWFRPCAEELLDRLRDEQRGWLARTLRRLKPEQAERQPLLVRDGIEEALAGLEQAGFVQVVTTGSFRDYALIGLERTGLRPYFAEVFGREQIWEGRGKRYQVVLEQFGVGPDRALIVGDDFKRDRDIDDTPIVLICQPEGHEEPAALLPPLIEAAAHPEGFRPGFEALYRSAPFQGLVRMVQLPEVHAAIDYWGDYRRGVKIPVLSSLRPPAAS